MAKTWFQVILDEIEKHIAQLEEFLGSGAAKDYTHYREVVGQIRGLRATALYVQELSRAYLENDND